MADLSTTPVLSVCTTVGSKLADLTVTDGQLTFVRDKHKIVLDFDGKRTIYDQIEELATEGARTSMLAPVTGRYYFVLETSVLWTYQDGWVQITTPPSEIPGPAIIDVVELPTENIDENSFYRLLTGTFVYNQYTHSNDNCFCVDGLPEVGEPATDAEMSTITAYYNTQDDELYGYVDAMLSMVFGVPIGWYPAAMLFQAAGLPYAGVITDILDCPIDDTYRVLLEYVIYSYKEGKWTSHKTIGWTGAGSGAEVFNHPANKAYGSVSHAEGRWTVAGEEGVESYGAHAEGWGTKALSDAAHAEGYLTLASGHSSHAEGDSTIASGCGTHAEGDSTIASGHASHAEGDSTIASGDYSHSEGDNTVANGKACHVQGMYNIIEDVPGDPHVNFGKYAHIVGNGDQRARSNAHTLDWDGNAWFQGKVMIGGTGQDDETAKELATLDDIPTVDNETLTLDNGVLKVNTTNSAEADNTLPITSAGVYTQLGNIQVLLETI